MSASRAPGCRRRRTATSKTYSMLKHNASGPEASAPLMTRRSYSQYCAVARGLDLIGDRWMLLIVRDLLLGPKRYSDLLDGLPGIGTNLLALRLREMEQAAIVERAGLSPPAASSADQLTEARRALEPVILPIGRWGSRFLGARRTDHALL